MIGKVLGHYLILKKLRADDFVEVYLAQDTNFSQLVVVKLFGAETHRSAAARKRFLNCADSVAALDHPGICRLLEAGKLEGRCFVSMEFVNGETIKERLMQGPIPLADTLQLASEVADALREAHSKGVIHCNLRPGNIMLTQEHHAKVMDFGLLGEPIPAARAKTPKYTVHPLSIAALSAGGATCYRSPEQLRAEPADARSDIFSFGIVLYEALTRVHPFKKQTESDTVNAILNSAPTPVAELCPRAPSHLQPVLGKMLAKVPSERYASVNEVQAELKTLLESASQPEGRWLVKGLQRLSAAREISGKPDEGLRPATWRTKLAAFPQWITLVRKARSGREGAAEDPTRTTKGLLKASRWIGAAMLAAILAGSWIFLRFFPILTASPPLPSPVVPPPLCPTVEDGLSLSPDGKWAAFRWKGKNQENWHIYVKELDGAGFHQVTSNHPANECCPAWSPDGRQIAFLRQKGIRWALHLINPSDGRERELTEIVDASRLSWSPDGKSIAFADREPPSDALSVWSISIDGTVKHKLTSPAGDGFGDDCPAYSPDGNYFAFIRHGKAGRPALHVMRLPGGEIILMMESHPPGAFCWTGDSRQIVLSTEPDSGEMSLWKMDVGDKQLRRIPAYGEHVWGPAISGDRLVYLNGPDYDIRRLELTGYGILRSSAGPVWVSPSDELTPSVSPDGNKIAFVSTSSGSKEIWICNSDGTSPRSLTDMRAGSTGNPRWSPNGQMIAFDSDKSGSNDIYLIDARGGPVRRITTDSAEEAVPRWSRDGRWIYFGSNKSGSWQIWKMSSDGGEWVQVTRNGGLAAHESSDGQYLYYQAHHTQKNGVWRVPVAGGMESLVLNDVESYLLWDLTDRGIYFINHAAKPRTAVSFFEFATQQVKDLPVDQDPPGLESSFGLSITPDGKWFYYSGAIPGFEISSIENFR